MTTPSIGPVLPVTTCRDAEQATTSTEPLRYWHSAMVAAPWHTNAYAVAARRLAYSGWTISQILANHQVDIQRLRWLLNHPHRQLPRLLLSAEWLYADVPRAVMLAQRNWLQTQADARKLTVRVLPTARVIARHGGRVTIPYALSVLPGLLYHQSRSTVDGWGSWTTTDPQLIEQGAGQFDRLWELAMPLFA
jgi:hypothetical protein